MPILGNSSSGGKGVSPDAPVIGAPTVTNTTTVSLAFTASFSKLPITSYTVTSTPSIALTTTGTSSPVSVTGSFAAGTSYTFTITATNAAGTSSASAASAAIWAFVRRLVAGFSAGVSTVSVLVATLRTRGFFTVSVSSVVLFMEGISINMGFDIVFF